MLAGASDSGPPPGGGPRCTFRDVGRAAPTSPRLLDRDRELGEIVDRLDAARAGAGSALVVEGPGGIGKTELLLAADRAARRRDMCVLSARGAELEREFAFGVVRQLLEASVQGPAAPS